MTDHHLPVHPVFGPAIGLRRNGAPIWAIRGASPEGDPPAPTPQPAPVDPPKPADPDDGGLGDGGKKALDTERSARKDAERRAKDAEAKVKEFEDAQKSEAERTADRIAALEKDAAKALRYEAAAAEGIPLTSAHRLNGSTLEELRADAQAYKAEIGGAAPQPTDPQSPLTPRPDKRQGGGQREVSDGSMAAGKAAYEANKAKGRT